MSTPATPPPSAADQMMGALFPVSEPASSPPPAGGNPVNPTSPAPVIPAGGEVDDDLSWLTAKPPGSPPPAAPPGTPAPQQTAPPPTQPATTPAAGEWTLERFLADKIAKPEDLFQDQGRITQFRDLRTLFENAARENQALHLELAQLRKAPPAAAADGTPAPVMPETEAVETLRRQLAELEPAAKQWQAEEARRNLQSLPSFRREFDAPRAGILRELNAAAEEIGLDDAQVQEFLGLGSEYKQARWITENIDDKTAADLFKAKGANFLSLSKNAEAIVQSDDPLARLKEWEDYEAAFSTKVAAKLDGAIAQQYQAAASRVVQRLTGSEDQYFQTDAGKAALGAIQKRFADGVGVAPEELVEALAHRSRADAYEAFAGRILQKLQAAEKEVARLSGMDPARRFLQGGPPPVNPVSGGSKPDFLGALDDPALGAPRPLISEEALAVALGRQSS
jgi:hypothetical protein